MVRRVLFPLLLIASVLVPATNAQVPDPVVAAEAPRPGAGHHYIGMGAETVNPADGSLSFDLPFQPPADRGLNLTFGIRFAGTEQFFLSNLWTQNGQLQWWPNSELGSQPFQVGAWSYDLPVLTATTSIFWSATIPYNGCPNGVCAFSTNYCYGNDGYVFRGLDGNQYSLPLGSVFPDPNNKQQGYCPSPPNNVKTPGNNHGILSSYQSSSLTTVVDPSGTTYQFPVGSGQPTEPPVPDSVPIMWGDLATTITDRNGNQLTINGNGYKDSAGRTAISWTGIGSSSGDQIDIAGLANPVTVQWTTTSVSFPETGTNISSNRNCSLAGSPTNISVVSEIDLPNGGKYTFDYANNQYGKVDKITFPEGGYVRYVWGLYVSGQGTYASWNQNGSPASCNFVFDTPAITDRYVSFDGTNEVLHQQFSYALPNWSSAGASGPIWSTRQTTVTTTDLLTGQVTKTIYNYSPANTDNNVYATKTLYSLLAPVETNVLYQDGSGKTFKEVNKTWLNPHLMLAEQTILYDSSGNRNAGSATPRCYDANEQVTSAYEYGFQTEGSYPGDQSCYSSATKVGSLNNSYIGPLRRQTTNVYHNFMGGSPPTHIVNAPDSATVADASGTTARQTLYSYDQNSLQPSGAINLSNPGATRANPTTLQRLISGSTYATTTYSYYDTGQVASMTDACGNTACADVTGSNHTATYSYADNYATGTPPGQTNAYLTTVTYPTPNSGVAQVEKFSWNYASGLIASRTDRNSQTTNFYYSDPLLRLTEVDYPPDPNNGNTRGKTTYSYNDALYSPTVTTSKLMNTSNQYVTGTSTMDGMGHMVKALLTSDPDCTSGDRTDTTYDGLGRVYTVSNPYCSTSDPTYGLTTYAYDALGRTTSVTEADGSVISSLYSGNCTTVTDEAGIKRQSCSDGLGRLTQMTEDPGGLGYITTYGYDALDNLLSVVQNGSRQRAFSYDSLSRLTGANNPESGVTQYAYDANGNLSGKLDARNIPTYYAYDALNRLIFVTHSDNYSTPNTNYYYDQSTTWDGSTVTNPIGRLTSVGTYDGTCWPTASGFGYDATGRVSYQLDFLNTVVTPSCNGHLSKTYAGYDLAGNQISLTYPSGRVIKSLYNGASRLTNLKVDDLNGYNYLSSATYAPNGAPATLALGNSLTETSTYNKRFQPNDLKVASSSTSLMEHVYNFNASHDNGNVVSIADNLVSGRTQNFTYDTLNRLSTAQTSATSGSDCWGGQFGYDAWGNLLTSTPTDCTFYSGNFGVNGNNQVTNTGFSYDLAGNMTADGTNTYAYDDESRLTSVNSGAATYIYDAQGRRMAKKIGSATTEYIYFNGDVLAEYNLGDEVWNDYIFAGGRRLAAAGTDDILNPGFEQGLEGWGTGESDSTGSAQLITDSTRAHSGNNYLQLSTTTAQVIADNQVVAVNPGDQLTFGGWAYLEPGSATGSWVSWNLVVRDANGNVLEFPTTASITSATWTLLSLNYTVPAGGASVMLYAQIYQPAGATTARFDDGFLTGASGLGVHYYHSDHLGSARLMTDSGGNVTWSATYLPFGQEWNPQATTNHYKFTGKERDAESNLDYMQARYYSNGLGRFVTPDWAAKATAVPYADFGDPQSLNLYAYVRNNPLSKADPDGHCGTPSGLTPGGVGVCVASYISSNTVGVIGRGDGRGPNGQGGTSRIETRLVVDTSQHTATKTDETINRSGIILKDVGPQGKGGSTVSSTQTDKEGNTYFQVSQDAHSSYSMGGAVLGSIDNHLNLAVTPDGKVGIDPGSSAKDFPSLEVYKYTMDDKGNVTTTQVFTKQESGHVSDLKQPEKPIKPQEPK